MAKTVTLIPGDGIGPEITESVVRILEAAGAQLVWDRQIAGETALKQVGNPMPQPTIDSIKAHSVALKGPLTTPSGTGFRSINVALRQE
ncbi:MAG TPA: isocitrate/isopropylmalate family dehydrogenase, partial [Longimicrobium sp.]|nr:isocitrate/isopropylmalate family dehydrogenase [Longimicrobium sp.]